MCPWQQTLLGREIQAERTRDKGLSERQAGIRVTGKRNKKLQSSLADVSPPSASGGGEKAGGMVGGPAWVLWLQLGGGGWFRVSRRKAEEG